jgi:polyketide cyclase/dehydrase/lipid transport protein
VQPITVSVQVGRPRDEVFAFLDDLGNHERFTDHMLVDWTLSGPATGVGAKARMRAPLPGPKDWLELEVLESVAPVRTVEETVGAKGRRRTRGTYTLEEAPDGGTLIRFELAFLQMPLYERPLAPLLRGWLARANAKAMVRLGEELAPGAPQRLRHAA